MSSSRPISAYSKWCTDHSLTPYSDLLPPQTFKMAPPPEWYHQQVANRHTYDIDPPRPGSAYDLESKRGSRMATGSGYNAGGYDGSEELLDDRDHRDGFDVRADFDGDGPRWSEVYRTSPKKDDSGSYRPVSSRMETTGSRSSRGEASKEELVSVPVLGAEWQRKELHSMSRRGQSEERKERRTAAWRSWIRDQRGLCGTKWLTRKTLVFVLFFFCAGLAITLFFVIPRAPSFSFYDRQPFIVNNDTIAFSRTPTNFSFTGNLNLFADATSSYLPVHFSNIQATVYDLATQKIIATGEYGNHVVPRKHNAPVVLPVEFSYSALNASDSTWNNMYNACGHIWPSSNRTDIKLRLELRMSIIGLVSHPISETQISGVACPFELDAQGV